MNRKNTLLVAAATSALLSLLGCKNEHPSPTDARSVSPSTSAASSPAGAQKKGRDGPMGVSKGISVDELKGFLGFKSDNNFVYSGKAPKPAEDSSTTLIVATEKTGVCRLIATFDVAPVNDTGDQLKNLVDRLHGALVIKYGDHFEKTEYFGQDVYRRNSQFWMMGLVEDSIVYAYTQDSTQDHPLPYELESIEVAARATDVSRGYATITYTFNNFQECRKENQAIKAKNL